MTRIPNRSHWVPQQTSRLVRAAWAAWGHHLVVVAVAAAGVLLAVSAAAAPVFTSSARGGSLQEQVTSFCPWDEHRAIGVHMQGPLTGTFSTDYAVRDRSRKGGLRVVHVEQPAALVQRERQALLDKRLASVPHLGPVMLSVLGGTVVSTAYAGKEATLADQLIYRDGAGKHLQFVERSPGEGVWLPDVTAHDVGAHAGDTITLAAGKASTQVRVAGVYRDLVALPKSEFWCSLASDIYPKSIFDTRPPPPIMVPTMATMRDLSRALGSPDADVLYERQVQIPLTVDQADRTATAAGNALVPLLAFPAPPGIRELGRFEVRPFYLDEEVDIARAVGAGITTPVSAIAAAGSAVALVLVAAVGALWVDRRRREVMLLSSKGVGAGAIGVQALAETVLPFLLGAAIGFAVGVTVVATLGPGPVLEAGTRAAAAVRVAVATAVGLGVLGLTAGLVARQVTETPVGRRRRWSVLVPWELALVGAAAALFVRSSAHGLDLSNMSVPTLRTSQLTFLLVALGGGVLLGVRCTAGLVALSRGRGASWPAAGYLAARRLTSSLRATALFIATVALPIAVLVAAQVLVATLRYTTDAKALAFIGSNTVFDLSTARAAPPPALRGKATVVGRIDDATLGGETVQVLAVDPASFADGAFWDDRFAGAPLPALLRRITVAGRAGTGPVLVSGVDIAGTATLHLPGTSSAGSEHGTDLPVRVVAHARDFPGKKGVPLVVVDRSIVPAGRVHVAPELWAKGDSTAAARALAAAGWQARFTVTLADVSRAPVLVVVTWTFGFLQGVAILVGVIAVGGLLLYLHTRQRRTQLAYAFARRMGLSRGGHVRSLLVETGCMLGAAFALGTGVATAAAYVIHGRLDPQPFVPPSPLFTAPGTVYLAVGLACIAVAAAAAAVVQIGADRANKAELLRISV